MFTFKLPAQNEWSSQKNMKKDHIDLKMVQVSLDFIDTLTFICRNQRSFH